MRASPAGQPPTASIAAALRAAIVACVLLLAGTANADRSGEYALKAALLRQLMNHVEWPSDAPINICVVGEDPFGAALDRAFVDLRARLRRLSANSTDLPTCALVFVAGSESAVAAALVARMRPRGTLSVSDLPTFTDAGGMVAMRMQDNRVRFRINVGHTRRAGLRVNAKLLRLSEIVGSNIPELP